MHRSDWKRGYRRVRCGSWKVDLRVSAAYLNRTSHWEACTAVRAAGLTQDLPHVVKRLLIADCRRAARMIRPLLP